MIEVSIRELKNNLTRYLRRLEEGERIRVTRRGKPIALLTASGDKAPGPNEAAIWALVDEGAVSWSGKKFVPPLTTISLHGDGPRISEMVIEDRR